MTLRPSLESKYSDNVTAEGLSVYKAAKQINVKMPGLKKTATASTDDSPLRQEVIVEEEIQHLDEQDMVGTSFDMLLDQSKQRDTIGKSILFKTQKSNYVEEGPCLSSNPVSIIITNIPSFKGGRANPWMESEQETMGIKDANRNTLIAHDLQDMFVEQSVCDGLLEMTVAQTLLDVARDHYRRGGQAEGPFEIKFNDQGDFENGVNFIQVDGEFLKCEGLLSIKFSLTPNLNEGSVWCRARSIFVDDDARSSLLLGS